MYPHLAPETDLEKVTHPHLSFQGNKDDSYLQPVKPLPATQPERTQRYGHPRSLTSPTANLRANSSEGTLMRAGVFRSNRSAREQAILDSDIRPILLNKAAWSPQALAAGLYGTSFHMEKLTLPLQKTNWLETGQCAQNFNFKFYLFYFSHTRSHHSFRDFQFHNSIETILNFQFCKRYYPLATFAEALEPEGPLNFIGQVPHHLRFLNQIITRLELKHFKIISEAKLFFVNVVQGGTQICDMQGAPAAVILMSHRPLEVYARFYFEFKC